ncbi:bifunctional hydroxymethylpyrimidine kinase/phosphomethylpyrimidine kinase [Massilia niastensis]|uniref:bifunctional hydroxymethylpyrimidine kinase/phosphomethylpyrimidine kinase n=1 Tax=Massilia niastensis TaxID=544911 RepID=UPI0004776D50|nr:hydroxymethylpyrimidine/phosphomethylpyrimidine kinase [Massilia niastensis]
MQNQPLPLILTFGVSDPVGALGVQADLAAFAALGCHGLSAVAGILVSDSARVENMYEVDSDWMAEQARVLLEDMPIAAFKVGAVSSALHLAAIAEIVSDYPDAPLILDPFLSALPDSGLGDEEMLSALRSILAPQATVLILSQHELGRMAEMWRDGGDGDGNLDEDVAELTSSGLQYVLVTGTRDDKGLCSNTLFDRDGVVARVDWNNLPGPFVGAGNTYSAAFTALMARGLDAPAALAAAQEYTTGALEHAQRFGMGKFIPNKFFRP